MRIRKRVIHIFLLVLLLSPVSPVFAIRYDITDLHPSGYDSSEAWGINNNGNAAGSVNGNVTVWQNNTAQVLTYIGTGMAINDSGQVTGLYHVDEPNSDLFHPFRWQNNTMTELLPLNNGTQSAGYGIDNSGTVVGYSITGSGEWRVSKWASGSTTATALPIILPTSQYFSWAFGISNNGNYVAGVSRKSSRTKPAMWQNSSITDLNQNISSMANSWSSWAYDVNDSGHAVGSASPLNPSYSYACLWKDGALTQISTAQSYAWSINNNDQVVGSNGGNPNNCSDAFYWSSDNGLVYLNEFAPGWDIKAALDINDSGQIVGWGINPDGEKHAYRLDPVLQWSIISNNSALINGETSESDIDALYDLWLAGKNGEDPDSLFVNGEEWEYFAEEFSGHEIGDTWIDDGYKYIYLGSGVRSKMIILNPIPEPLTIILILLGLFSLIGKYELKKVIP